MMVQQEPHVHGSVVPARRQARGAVPLGRRDHCFRQAVAITAFAAGCTFAALLAADGGRGGAVTSLLGRSVPEGGATVGHAPRARDLARSCGRSGHEACEAFQTSTVSGGDASLALDAGPQSTDSCTESQAQKDPWWRLDFGRVVTVVGLRVFVHRVSMCDALGVGIMPGSEQEPINMNVGVPCGCAKSSAAAPVAAGEPSLDTYLLFSPDGGPEGRGVLTLRRELKQFIATGTRALKPASKGGLTVVAVVKFVGTAGDYERIIDFGNGAADDNILLCRKGPGNDLAFMGFNGGTKVCVIEKAAVLKQDKWLVIVVSYKAADLSLKMHVNGDEVASGTCSSALTDRSVTKTFIGKSNWDNNPTVNADVGGVLVSDKHLGADEIKAVSAAMLVGHDPVCSYQDKKLNGWQVRVGNIPMAPDSNPACVHPPSHPMTAVALKAPEGEYREVNCTSAVHGRYLFIQVAGLKRVLSICNVQVWGKEYDPWVEGGTNEEKWLYGPEPAWHTNGCVEGAQWCTRVGENIYFIPP